MAVRFDASGDDLRRTANLPTSTAFTISGWAHMVTDTNAFATLCSLESGAVSAANYLLLSTDSDGTSLKVWSSATGASSATIATLVPGTPFFFALTCSGTGATSAIGYYKAAGSNALTSVSYNGVSFTSGALFIANDSFTEPFSGRVWGVKVWDRALSAAELLAESYFDRPIFPSSLNCWWPLPNSSDTTDKGGNARNPTVTGTLTTEDSSFNLWKPRQRVFVPAAVSGAISGTSDMVFGAGSSTLTGAGALAGTAALVFGAGSSTLTGAGALTGSSALTFTPAGTLAGAGSLAGAAAMLFGGTGALDGAGALAGSSAIVFTPTGTLDVPAGEISGVASMVLSASGALTGAGELSGSAPMTFSTQATADQPAPAPRARRGVARSYIIRGKRYLLTNEQLVYMLAHELIDATREDIRVKYKAKKPHVISKNHWAELLETMKSLEKAIPEEYDESDDEEAFVALM